MKEKPTISIRSITSRVAPSVACYVSAILIALLARADAVNGGPLAPVLGNYPNTLLVLSGETTVTPDAPPASTVKITVASSTNFKGRLEGDPTTGVVRITNAHPAGDYPVTVRAFDGAGASVTKTFMLTVTTPVTCVPISFGSANHLGAGSGPISVAVGDFNGDGKQDLVAANYGSNNVSILLGTGMGSFGAATNFGTGTAPQAVALGDFNGDGKQDIAVANSGSNNVSILLGTGTGSFSAATSFTAGNSPYSVAGGDFNGDGRQDLAVANLQSNNVSILLGNGAGSFSAPTNFPAGSNPVSVAVGDFNGDSKQDLAVANNQSSNVSILLGTGTGSFGTATNFVAGGSPQTVVVGDFNGDGRQDLAVGTVTVSKENDIAILLGTGTGTFNPATSFTAGSYPQSVAVGDFNGDGKQDLAVPGDSTGNVLILLGDGAGNFSVAAEFEAGLFPSSIAVGDFNGDGLEDLVAANYGFDNDVSILLRDCALTPTSAVSRRTHGAAGSFDINLPLTGTTGVECRSGGATNDFTMVVTFPGNVAVYFDQPAEVTSGIGTVGSNGSSNGGNVDVNGNVVTIPLTNVADQQTINVTLRGLRSIDVLGTDLVIPMSRLLGDVNGNRSVTASDVGATKSQSGVPVTAANFRADVNASGTINATDIGQVKASSGHTVP